MCIFSAKGRYMTSKIKILVQSLVLWEGHFDHLGVKKSFFGLFESGFEDVQKLLRHYFWP